MNARFKVDPVIPHPIDGMRAPFPDHQISKLPKETRAQIDARKADKALMVWRCDVCGGPHHKNATHLDYVGHAALTDRLLDVDPTWAWEPLALDADGLPALDRNGGLWIRLTVLGITRLGYGAADGKSGGDAIKEIIGDALRNAAMRFGAALDLWHKGDLHLDPEDATGGFSEDSSGDGKVSRDEPANYTTDAQEEKGWREPDSIYSTPTKLRAAHNALTRELNGCGDSEMVYALTSTDEWKEFVRVAELHAPHSLRGGPPAPSEYKGLLNIAADMVAGFDGAEAQGKVDLVGAG